MQSVCLGFSFTSCVIFSWLAAYLILHKSVVVKGAVKECLAVTQELLLKDYRL